MTESLNRIRAFLADREPPTPCLVVDTDLVADRTAAVSAAFPGALIRYAVKANPVPAVLDAVRSAGAGFDVASTGEIDLCLSRGADAGELAYGNTIKKPSDISYAYARGVREFTTDSAGDLANLAEHAPGSLVSIRLLTGGPDSVTPFGHKFGCEPSVAAALLRRAAEAGLRPGIAFHVGSQQPDPAAWEIGIATAAKVAADAGVGPARLNIGGGFATEHREPVPSLAGYAAVIHDAIRRHLPGPELMLEPGRVIVADAGLIRTEVVLVTTRAVADERRWVYLDVGRYNGMAECENEAVAYRLEPVGVKGPEGPVVLAGPTCDGDDVLYQRTPCALPLALKAGDRLDIPGTGAYTASYSSVAFNGIEPLRTYAVGRFADAG
ncbi:type III PLP-dependent enzyme [Amycolatopsis regifaucium]|uniref:ornithine decarboxylase n=1 Tax=Amycolatopsis regifaucium TaxID=546365 RepID=A0A154MQ21_9PSEU|nr:type III PLP-dependent enzyme [Amycolatopsis regifaucium]KZB86190.1 ornithine decarboxylase [Amycolatopsis regifaucium]OKA05081.1 ornithine decarboxylase [Amycolatopsis regifaucium]SFH81339.1 ornithine decarboxylase [Amycolatopsis regifaucium]